MLLRHIVMLFGTVSSLLAASATLARAQGPIMPRIACDALAGLDLSAELGVPARVNAAAIQADNRPAPVCHVSGTIRGTIGFEAWLPLERWTGRYLQIGCGGLCGRVSASAPQASGCVSYEPGEFAMAATDMGHTDPTAASWGGDPERRTDFAERAQHLTARASKLIIARFYGEGPRRSYFSGCSDGGREGLMEAMFHPEDFDGIAAGAPALDFTAQNTFHHAWTVQRNRRADGSAALTADRGAARVDEAARLFLIPGLAHCQGGAGPLTRVDTLTPLIRWVEDGVTPGDLAGSVASTGDVPPPEFLGADRFGPRRSMPRSN